ARSFFLHYKLSRIPPTFLTLSVQFQGFTPYFGQSSKNIVYVGSPAACEEIADKIRQWFDDANGHSSRIPDVPDDIKELANFIRVHIHPDYYLADMVERGVAFHFGHMPTILRKAIEEAFCDHPYMKYIVCTSTLLHGVNLPAKNMFMLQPSEGERWLSGNADPIQSSSFWNLAGRAGRLGKDFEGNVFLINKSGWKNDPLKGEHEFKVSSSFYSILQEKPVSLLSLARSESEQLTDSPEDRTMQSAFVKLYTDYRSGRLDKVLTKSPVPIPRDFYKQLVDAFSKLHFTVPDAILENNVAISPYRQQVMLDYQLNKIDRGECDDLIPLHPEARRATESYIRLFKRYDKCFDGRATSSRRPVRLALIALEWMKGTPYPVMIKKQQEFKSGSSVPVVVRETMDTIENEIRFKLVQKTRCYLDLLVHALEKTGSPEKVQSLPSLPLYLEIGACSVTMISLVGLGFSRTTAGLLNEKAAKHQMDRAECLRWLQGENWNISDLPRISISEIKNIVSV
ncbi:MAG: hypothetical protein JW901_06020, partial [Dehalococcoidia bacterium]|nr:hypothetical protein [Dehalococcoidia bacterium]